MAATVRRDGLQACDVAAIAFVIHQRPGAIERRRTEIAGIPAHGIAAGMANTAIDAFDACIGRHTRRRVRPNLRDRVVPRFCRRKDTLGVLPLLEEGLHVGGQILDHRQVLERANFEPATAGDLGHMGPAGPARPAVHGHGAGAAHADPACEAIRQCRVDVALHERDHVEHGLTFPPRHGVGLVTALLSATPKRYRKL